MKQNEIMQLLLERQALLQLTSAEVSAMANIPKNTYCNMRSGNQYDSFETMEQIANALGLELVLTYMREGRNVYQIRRRVRP